MSDVNAAVVLIVDASGSMQTMGYMQSAIIDSKAFIRSSRPGDQIAVVKFGDVAGMVYPRPPSFETVDPGLTVTAAAATAIGSLQAYGETNMRQALELANKIRETCTLPTESEAYVMLTDGAWNVGGDPTSVTPTDLPIYVCGLGPRMREDLIAGMLSRNSRSKYIASADANVMMKVFNQIIGLADKVDVVTNQIDPYVGTDYLFTPIQLSDTTDESQISVVWSNPALSYTPASPDPTHINIVLVDPRGNSTKIRPEIAEPGYAIYNLNSPQPGKWQVLAQYASQHGSLATTAGFEFDSASHLALDVEPSVDVGVPVTIRAQIVHGDQVIPQAQVQFEVSAPRHDVPELLDRHATAIDEHISGLIDQGGVSSVEDHGARLAALQDILRVDDPAFSIVEQHKTVHLPQIGDDGFFAAQISGFPHSGDYTVTARATATSPGGQVPFSRTTMATIEARK